MSLVLGVNAGKTLNDKPLKDGGACLIKNNKIIGAIPEERLTGNKHDGGYKYAVKHLLSTNGYREADIDLVVHSSCCEPERIPSSLTSKYKKVISLNHHLSHAYNAFSLSPFKEALVLVFDAGGNVLEDMTSGKWWEHKREQHSYFIAGPSGIKLLERDCDEPMDCGIGELMRAFTYFLGWPSGMLAGNTMAAGKVIINKCFSNVEIFDFKDGKIISPLENSPYEAVISVRNLIKEKLGQDIEPNVTNQPLDKIYFQIANWVQWNIESVIRKKTEYLVKKTGIKNICLSGGVAYNCPTINGLRAATGVDNIYVSWTSGDHGQSIGNALYGFTQLEKRQTIEAQPYLGGNYSTTKSKIQLALNNNTEFSISECKDLELEIALELKANKIVAVHYGRSESGPRALGNRSLLARASHKGNKDKLNKIKSRMDFMPVAPVILEENLYEMFNTKSPIPFMTETVEASTASITAKYPAAFHFDGSARVQSVHETSNSILRGVLEQFEKLTAEKLILNTSFNLKGKPIVEDINDAIKTFMMAEGIDVLFVGSYKVTRKP